jgi:hypothetical protein
MIVYMSQMITEYLEGKQICLYIILKGSGVCMKSLPKLTEDNNGIICFGTFYSVYI